jgi:hypothetical protein
MSRTKERIRAVINSKNRLNPNTETSHNFTFSFNSAASRITEIMIERVEIPFSFYIINSSNNVLTFNNGVNSITLTPGNYTGTTILTEMIYQLNIAFAGQSPTVTFSSSTYKLTISKSTAFIVDSSNDVPASTASYVLGFHETSSSSTSVIADSALNISGPNYILITSWYFTKPIQHKMLYSDSTYNSGFWAVPVSASPGDTIIETPAMTIRFNSKSVIKTTDIIDIQLFDDSGNPLDLNGLDWSMQLILITE